MFNISMKQIIIAIGNRDRDHPLVLLRSDDRATNCGTTGYRDNPGTDPGTGISGAGNHTHCYYDIGHYDRCAPGNETRTTEGTNGEYARWE